MKEVEAEKKARNSKLNLSIGMEFAFVDFLFDHFSPLYLVDANAPFFSFFCPHFHIFARTLCCSGPFDFCFRFFCCCFYVNGFICLLKPKILYVFYDILAYGQNVHAYKTHRHVHRTHEHGGWTRKWGRKKTSDRYACDCANIIDCWKVRKPSEKRFNVMNCGNVWQPESYESLQT